MHDCKDIAFAYIKSDIVKRQLLIKLSIVILVAAFITLISKMRA